MQRNRTKKRNNYLTETKKYVEDVNQENKESHSQMSTKLTENAVKMENKLEENVTKTTTNSKPGAITDPSQIPKQVTLLNPNLIVPIKPSQTTLTSETKPAEIRPQSFDINELTESLTRKLQASNEKNYTVNQVTDLITNFSKVVQQHNISSSGIDTKTITIASDKVSEYTLPHNLVTTIPDAPTVIDLATNEKAFDLTTHEAVTLENVLTSLPANYASKLLPDDFASLTPVTGMASIFAMASMYIMEGTPVPMLDDTAISVIVDASKEYFRPGLQNLRHVFNKNFLEDNKLLLLNDLPYADQLQYSADTVITKSDNPSNVLESPLVKQNQMSYIAGKLMMLLVLGKFNQFLVVGKDIVEIPSQLLNEPFSTFLKNKISDISMPNLLKAVYNFNDDVPWLQQYVLDLMEDRTYRLGKIADQHVSALRTSVVYAKDGIDQFTAALNNFNIAQFLSNKDNQDSFINKLSTYLLEGSQVDWDMSINQLQTYIKPDLRARLEYFFTYFIYCSSLYSQMIYSYHSQAMKMAVKFITREDNVLFGTPSGDASVTPQILAVQKAYTERVEHTRGLADLEKLCVMQIIPPIHYLELATNSIPEHQSVDSIIATLSVASLFSLFFPLTFQMTIGLFQNWYYNSLKFFNGGSSKLTNIKTRYGVAYRKVDGVIKFNHDHDQWSQVLYRDGWLPILHGLVYFPAEFTMPDNLTKVICSLFRPEIVMIPDSPNALNSHPRVRTEHMLPFPISHNSQHSKLMLALGTRADTLRELRNNVKEGPSSGSQSNALKSATNDVINHLFLIIATPFANCMQNHVMYWLKVVANTGAAVLPNWPKDAFECPYSEYGFVGETKPRPLVGARDIDATNDDIIDYNVILTYLSTYVTPSVSLVSDELNRRVLGGPGAPAFKYRNVPEAYRLLMKKDEELYRTMEDVSYAVGIVDLMYINGIQLYYEILSVFDLEGIMTGMINFVSEENYLKYFKPIMTAYGMQGLEMKITTTTTENQIIEYLTDQDNPRLLHVTGLNNTLYDFINNLEIFTFVMIDQEVFNAWYTDVEDEQASLGLSDLFPSFLPEVDIKSIIDPAGYTSNLSKGVWKSMLHYIGEVLNVRIPINDMQNYSEKVPVAYDPGTRLIRRLSEGRPVPYDSNVDPIAFKRYRYGISDRCGARLILIRNLFSCKAVPKVHKGLVLASTTPAKFIFYHTFDYTGLRIIEYDDTTVGLRQNEDGTRSYSMFIDGVPIDWQALPEKVCVRISKNFHNRLNKTKYAILLAGVKASRCVILLPDYEYRYSVNNVETSSTSDLNTLFPENYSFSSIAHITFYDQSNCLYYSRSAGIDNTYRIKMIYPMEDLREGYQILDLSSSDVRPEYTKIDVSDLYDTGLEQGGELVEHNYFTDGTEKIQPNAPLSTSNYVSMVYPSMVVNREISYTVIDPQYDLKA